MKKVLSIILMAVLVTAVFVSCDDPKHEHSYSQKHDETNHWMECSCGDKKDVEAHTFGEWKSSTEDEKVERKCTVCEYIEKAEGTCVTTAEALKAAIEKEGINTIVLTKDIELKEIITVTKTIVLDMNGKTISLDVGDTSAGQINVEKTGNLTVRGNGKTTFTDNYYNNGNNKQGISGYTFNVMGDAVLTIEDGDYYGCMGVVQAGTKGATDEKYNVYIKGGKFESNVKYKSRYWTLNKFDGTTGKLSVSGGSFVNFDPSKPNTNDDTSYLAEGYKVTQETKDSKTIYTVSK